MTSTKEKAAKKKVGKVKIAFEFFAPESKKVQLAGTFNAWKPVSLKKTSEGKWAASIDLEPGRYEYRFFVDGTWQNDQKQCECVPNAFGSWNCVLNVS
jgi:1,4-alpha-glucan branching enzyme